MFVENLEALHTLVRGWMTLVLSVASAALRTVRTPVLVVGGTRTVRCGPGLQFFCAEDLVGRLHRSAEEACERKEMMLLHQVECPHAFLLNEILLSCRFLQRAFAAYTVRRGFK